MPDWLHALIHPILQHRLGCSQRQFHLLKIHQYSLSSCVQQCLQKCPSKQNRLANTVAPKPKMALTSSRYQQKEHSHTGYQVDHIQKNRPTKLNYKSGQANPLNLPSRVCVCVSEVALPRFWKCAGGSPRSRDRVRPIIGNRIVGLWHPEKLAFSI